MTRSKDTSSKSVKVTPRQLPAWYARVFAITLTQDRDPYSEEFDEDLSELDEDTKSDGNEGDEDEDKKSGGHECDCDADAAHECKREADNVSERSYNGSDASYYYELKDRREGRKRELFRLRNRATQQIESQRSKLEEVRVAYKKLKRAVRKDSSAAPQLECLSGKHFDLSSPEYAEHCSAQHANVNNRLRNFVQFYHLSEQGLPQDCDKNSPCRRQVHGHICFDGPGGLEFKHFASPAHASRKSLRVKADEGDRINVEVSFISDDCLQMRLDARHVFRDGPRPKSAPKVFGFAGVRREWKDEAVKWQTMSSWRALGNRR
ncbi:hypothetical protein PT974_00448 [Cladobotryum mycophilum]|uniref:Uncharacterized protein n=1 Tax=Cladobotryum mycophilum TaxID=491253 RepID=A0ABR0T237_9HYPO